MADKKTQATVYFHNQAGLNEWQRKYYSQLIIIDKLDTTEGNETGSVITFCLDAKHIIKNVSYFKQLEHIKIDAQTIDYYHSGINTVRLF